MKYIEKYWVVIIIVFGLFMFIKPAFCFLLLGSLIFYIALESALFLRRLQKNGIECSGKIVDYESDSEGYKTPFVEFLSLSGKFIKEKPFVYASTDINKLRSHKKMIDRSVSILYDPDEPQKFILVNENGFNYFFITLFMIAGLGFATLSIFSFLGYLKIG